MNSTGGILKSGSGRKGFDEEGTATYGQQGNFMSKTSFNQTQGSMGGGANPGSLKGKLMSLEVDNSHSKSVG